MGVIKGNPRSLEYSSCVHTKLCTGSFESAAPTMFLTGGK